MLADLVKEIGLTLHITYFIREFNERLDSSIKNNTDLDIKKEVEKLTSFCISDSFIPYLCCETDCNAPFFGFISLYESKGKFLSLKIILSLSEQLKIKKIDINNKIKIVRDSSNEKKINIVNQFLDDIKNKDSYQEFKNDTNNKTLTNPFAFYNFAQEYINKNKSHFRSLYEFYISFVEFFFNVSHFHIKLDDKFFGIENSEDSEKNQNLILENLYN